MGFSDDELDELEAFLGNNPWACLHSSYSSDPTLPSASRHTFPKTSALKLASLNNL